MTASIAASGHRSISFLCVYAPGDASFYKQLVQHLRPLRSQHSISMWSVDDILPGTNRDTEIERYLNDAQIILFLLSAGFFEHCYDIMIRALRLHREKHVLVVPIILRPVDWENSPVSVLQVLPINGKPVTSWRNRDDAYLVITKEIRKIIGLLLNPITDYRTITEHYLRYLHWLIKRTSSLDTRGIFSTQRPLQIKLEEIYISLRARHEGVLQTAGPTPFSEVLAAEASKETQSLPPLPLSQVIAHHDCLMLLGEPGSGKTTFLHYLALMFCVI